MYFSGAKLENLLNEAAILAAKRNSGTIEPEDIDKAFYIVIAGLEKKDRSAIHTFDRRVTAFHEAGHALITRIIAPEHKVSRVTIIPSTKGAGGFIMSIPPDRMYYKKIDMENSIKIALAGRAAEEIVFGEKNITTGASNDLEKATQILMDMITRFGMGKGSGLLSYNVLFNNGIRQVEDEIIRESRDIMNSYYTAVRNILVQNKPILEAVAMALLEKETLNEYELDQIISITREEMKSSA